MNLDQLRHREMTRATINLFVLLAVSLIIVTYLSR